MRFAALTGILLLLAGCSGGPPRELSGMWSAGPAACAAGIGLEFGEKAVEAVYVDDREMLFARPRYEVMRRADPFRVRIRYDLPGRAHSAGAGVLDLERGEDGGLRPISHRFEDALTGSVRISIGDDPIVTAMRIQPCDRRSWIGNLRGRSTR